MTVVKVAYLIFELGSLQVFTMQEPSYIGANPEWTPEMHTDNWHWRDAGSPQGYGPFTSLTACMDHYKWVIMTCKDSQKQITGAVKSASIIRYDFQNKRRVISDV